MDLPLDNLSLCTGGGGLDLGLELALPSVRTVCCVEREGFALDYVATGMEAGALGAAPLFTDLREFDGRPWRGCVDCVTAGYPCQPFSTAGERRGEADPRHLWPEVHRILGEVEPVLVVLENVAGHLSLGFERVVADLQGLGYRVAAGLFTAEEVGASHKRERLFIVALADGDDAQRRREISQRESAWGETPQRTGGGGRGLALADGGNVQREGLLLDDDRPQREESADAAQLSFGALADAYVYGREGVECNHDRFDGTDEVLPTELPRRTLAVGGDHDDLADEDLPSSRRGPKNSPRGDGFSKPTSGSPRRLNPTFTSWLMGWPRVAHVGSNFWATAWSRCKRRMRSRLSSLCSAWERESDESVVGSR